MNKDSPSAIESKASISATLVEVLYHGLLGRNPEPEGLRYWGAKIEGGATVSDLLTEFMASPEYVQKSVVTLDLMQHAAGIAVGARRLRNGVPMVIVDVGAQILDYEAHVYASLTKSGMPCRIIGFEPLEHRRQEWLSADERVQVEMHSEFIGDGKEQTFYINDPDATSSLLPFSKATTQALLGLHNLCTVRTASVNTATLDSILAGESQIDFLKLDIQGFELPALKCAAETLKRTAVIHCEVSFVEIYEGQALFSEVETYLRSQGFRFVDFFHECRYAICGVSPKTQDQLGWADAVFFRESAEGADPALLLSQSVIAFFVYGKLSLGANLARKYDRLAGADLAGTFVGQSKAA
jgi:FkbM family methyltransferase